MNTDKPNCLRDSAVHCGTWLSIGSPVIAELAALSGFDWVLIDLEHGCESEAAVPNQLRALRGSPTKGIVRVGSPHPDLIARVLDWGAHGIMVPHVSSASEAEAIVQAAYYPPRGRRGYSRTVRAHNYGLRTPNATPLVMAQIETIAGVSNAEAIAQVEAIDVLFVGPADLSYALKSHADSAPGDYDHCIDNVLAATKAHGKAAGILVRDVSMLQDYVARGFTHIAIDSDLAILRNAYQQILSQIQGKT